MSNTQQKKIENVGIGRCALFGAVGFGIGGIILGITFLAPWEAWIFPFFGMLAMGAFGGAALGLALRTGRRKTIGLALFCGIGVLAGFLSFVLAGENSLIAVFLFSMPGVLAGVALGLALRRGMRNTIGLAVAGGLGFGIGFMIGIFFGLIISGSYPFLPFVVMGVIGGASLGAVLGYLEENETSPPKPASLLASDAE